MLMGCSSSEVNLNLKCSFQGLDSTTRHALHRFIYIVRQSDRSLLAGLTVKVRDNDVAINSIST